MICTSSDRNKVGRWNSDEFPVGRQSPQTNVSREKNSFHEPTAVVQNTTTDGVCIPPELIRVSQSFRADSLRV